MHICKAHNIVPRSLCMPVYIELPGIPQQKVPACNPSPLNLKCKFKLRSESSLREAVYEPFKTCEL